jgi:hypothetical protein
MLAGVHEVEPARDDADRSGALDGQCTTMSVTIDAARETGEHANTGLRQVSPEFARDRTTVCRGGAGADDGDTPWRQRAEVTATEQDGRRKAIGWTPTVIVVAEPQHARAPGPPKHAPTSRSAPLAAERAIRRIALASAARGGGSRGADTRRRPLPCRRRRAGRHALPGEVAETGGRAAA